MLKQNKDNQDWRYIYILEVDNHFNKSKFFGKTKIYYTGQAINLKRRLLEHLHGMNSSFLRTNFQDASKKLVFVKYLYGTEEEVIVEEQKIKNKTREQKKELISSDENMLVSYLPCKAIILKKNGNLGEEICIKL